MRIEDSLRRGQGCGKNKIFVIGFNKTAGTTIAHLCMKNLLEARHQPNWGFSIGLGKNSRGNFWGKFKCFSDGGDREDFKFLSASYPDSLFILNCRPIKDWLFSRFKHGVFERINQEKKGEPFPVASEILRLEEDGSYRKFINEPFYPCTSQKLHNWIIRSQEHYIEVIRYFSAHPDQLIITDISQNDWLTFLCDHSGLKHYDLHSNSRSPSILNQTDLKYFATSLDKACASLDVKLTELESPLLLPDFLTKEVNDSLKLIKNNLSKTKGL